MAKIQLRSGNQDAVISGVKQRSVVVFVALVGLAVMFSMGTNGISGAGGLTAANTYQGNTLVSEGKLTLSGAGSIASSLTITVGSGATLDVSGVTSGANHDGTRFALQSGQTLQGKGTVTGPVSVLAGAFQELIRFPLLQGGALLGAEMR